MSLAYLMSPAYFFIFPLGHVDPVCKKKYNPFTVQEKMKFEKLNTPVCEQSFKYVKFFFFYSSVVF